jgi:hypothetical protein
MYARKKEYCMWVGGLVGGIAETRENEGGWIWLKTYGDMISDIAYMTESIILKLIFYYNENENMSRALVAHACNPIF